MAEAKRVFATRKGQEALAYFDAGRWSIGLPKARAALELFEMDSSNVDEGDLALLQGGICIALAALGNVSEALRMYAQHAAKISDDSLKDQLLQLWMEDVNAPLPGDLVQFLGTSEIQLVAVAMHPLLTTGHWAVKVCGAASAETGVDGVAAAPTGESGRIIHASPKDLTQLTLALSEEQRDRWRTIKDGVPHLFGPRLREENESRWLRLFGAAARQRATSGSSVAGVGGCGSSEDLGLPLEQTFVATLHDLLHTYLGASPGASEQTQIIVDILGCRPALELAEDPVRPLLAILRTLPSHVNSLTVRMCGPEMDCEARIGDVIFLDDGSGRSLQLELQPGLYHSVFPNCGGHLVVAMNAGVGVPQYYTTWGHTLDLLSKQKRECIFGLTSYTPGELIREERLLRTRWAMLLRLAEVPELERELLPRTQQRPPWTLRKNIHFKRGAESILLSRGDVVFPSSSQWRPKESDKLPAVVRVCPCRDLIYVGPNLTPGRSRSYGQLVLRVGGGRLGSS